MKRDMELIRLLLLRSEGDQKAAKECEKFSIEERAYHVQLLVDAGLVEAVVRRGPNDEFTGAVVSRLTWEGHEFLQSVRDDKLWNRAKVQLMKSGASWTFEILKAWATQEIKQKMGIPIE